MIEYKSKNNNKNNNKNKTKNKTKNLKNKSNKKTLKKNNIKQKGGALDRFGLIGQGTFGCSYNPPLKCLSTSGVCQEGNSDPRCLGISKLQSLYFSRTEFNKVSILDLLKFDEQHRYHLPTPFMCPTNVDQDILFDTRNGGQCKLKMSMLNEPHLLFYSYAGLDFFKMLYRIEREKTIHTINPNSVLGAKGLKNILEGVKALQRKDLVHLDIKDDNIVTGLLQDSIPIENTDQISYYLIENIVLSLTDYKLIDFAMMSLISHESKRSFLLPPPVSKPYSRHTVKETKTEKDDRLDKNKKIEEIYSFLDILSSSKDKQHAPRVKLSNLNAIHSYYPIYSIFVGKTYEQINQMNEETINNRVRDFMGSEKIKIIIFFFRKTFSDFGPLSDKLRLDFSMEEELKIALRSILELLKNETLFYSTQIKLIKMLDLYAWGVVLLSYYIKLLEYIKSPSDNYLKRNYPELPGEILSFLYESNILDPLEFLNHEMQNFNIHLDNYIDNILELFTRKFRRFIEYRSSLNNLDSVQDLNLEEILSGLNAFETLEQVAEQ